ncbi:MAG: XrtA/PEP-CTERM system TPR-repeat protein PrsT [Sedimenticola sp.]
MRVVPLVLITALLVGCDGVGGSSDSEHVLKAKEFYVQDKLKAATIELKNALTKNESNLQARMLLAEIYLETGNYYAAEKELLRAGDLGISDHVIVPYLARSYVSQGKNSEVLELRLPDTASESARSMYHAARGYALLAKADYAAAEKEILRSIHLDGQSVYALSAKAILMARRDDLDSAYSLLDKVNEIDPEYGLAWSYRGDLQRNEGEKGKALESYTQAIKHLANNRFEILKRALLNIEMGQYESAQEDVDRLSARESNSPGVLYAQGLIHIHHGRLSDALNSLEQAILRSKDFIQASYQLGAVHFQAGNMEQAAKTLSPLAYGAGPTAFHAGKLLATIRLRQGDPVSSEELIRPLVSKKPEDIELLNILSSALLGQGRIDEAVDVLQKIAAVEPDSAQAKINLGVGLIKGGQVEAGYKALEDAIDLNPESSQADFLLIYSKLQNQELDKAQQAAEAFAKRQADNPQAQNLLGATYLDKGMRPQARDAFLRARELSAGNPTAAHNLALLAKADGDSEKAKSYYEEVLAKYENHSPTLLRLAVLHGELGEHAIMMNKLEKAVDANPSGWRPRVILAGELLKERKPERAYSVLGDIIENQKNNPTVISIAGRIQLALQDYSSAKESLLLWTKLQPESAEAYYLLSRVYSRLNKPKRLRDMLLKAVDLDPQNLPYNIALTRTYLLDGEIDEVTNRLAELKKLAPSNPDVLSLEANLLAKSGKNGEALSIYKKIFDDRQDTSSLLVLAAFQRSVDDSAGAINLLEGWLKVHPDDVPAILVLAELYQESNRSDEVVEQYRKVLEQAKGNLLALNNLAWHLRESNPEQALSFAKQAESIAPDSAAIMDTLAEIMLAKGELERAERFNQKSLDKTPNNLTFRYRKAKIMKAKGDMDGALKQLKLILASNKHFPEQAEAEQMLKQIEG